MHINKLKLSRFITSLIVLMGIAARAIAADMSALNFNGDLIGKVIPDGTVINFDNELIGHITADGFVYNDEKNIIGGVVPQGVAISYNNSILGKVSNDGSVTAVNDTLVGKVLPNGLVVNDNYDILGAVVSPGLVYDDAGQITGRVSGDGRFYNLVGENTGYVTASGYVFTAGTDRKVALAGRLITSKIVVSSTGKFLGSIAPDGKVIDVNKKTVGNIHANGFVYAADGKIIGQMAESGYAFNLDGKYIGVVSYNGEVTDKGATIARAVNGGRVINKDGKVIGFTVSLSATANTLEGKYLGRITAKGEIARGRNIVGKIGASGNVVNEKGEVVGVINAEGPVFDYLGELKANAAVGGRVVSLEGVDLGQMVQKSAFDTNGNQLGRIMDARLNFNNSNEFIGVSGINSILPFNGKVYKTSPYGYVYDETGNLNGRNYPLGHIFSAEGNMLSYTTGNGQTENSSLNEIAKLTGSGMFLDKNNKLLGKVIEDKYVTNFEGATLGFVTPVYQVVNMRDQKIAKILPDGNAVGLSGKNTEIYGRAGASPVSVSINGDYLGYNLLDGKIVDGTENIGKISSNGNALDNMGALYGGTAPLGAVVSPECKFLGVVSDSGEARTSAGAYLGMVLTNGQIMNETENVIGHIVVPQAVSGKKGEMLGISGPLGNVLNYSNQNMGCVGADGLVRNPQKEIVGQTISYTPIMGFNNKIIGYTDFYGNVVDNSGVQIAVRDIDGSILAKNGENVGVPFKYTVAFDSNNVYLGRVKPDGRVVSDAGEILGIVQYNGEVVIKGSKNGFALYDLYVYDNDGKTIGYIAKNGRVYSIMGEMKGTIYNGFVVDKKQNLIGRGARDYEIRNAAHEIIGHLKLDGSVLDVKNIEVGQLQPNGDIKNAGGNIIAKAERLQYYQRPAEPEDEDEQSESEREEENEEKTGDNKNQNNEESSSDDQPAATEMINENEEIESAADAPEETPEDEALIEQRRNRGFLGIAVTPGGNIIGDVLGDNTVVDDNGETIGRVNENGEVIDNDGNTVGQLQKPQVQDTLGANTRARWIDAVVRNTTINPYDNTDEATFVGPGGGIGPGGRYNPQRAAILAQLQNERRQTMAAAVVTPGFNAASYTGWQDDWGIPRAVSTLRVNMDNMITADKPIPAVMARSLISFGSAPVTAIVERNIYGDTGRNVIIPAGSRIIGGLQDIDGEDRFDSTSGGVKLEIAWSRIIRPDGIAFILDAGTSQTGDAQGRGGGALGYVDEQLVKKYTLPIVGTLASSAITYMMAVDEESTGEVENSKQQAASDARQQFMDKMDQILQQIIDSKSQIQSVTYIPAGTRIIIYPMRDLWLRSTKDIERGVATDIPSSGQGGLVTEEVVGGGAGTTTTSTVESNNGGGSRKVILGGQSNRGTSNQDNSGGGGTPLISEEPQNNNQRRNTGQNNTGALPPPAADGSITGVPPSEDELSEEVEGIPPLY